MLQLKERGVSERRGCKVLGVCRTSIRYESQPEDPVNELVRQELRELARRNRRYGTPRMTALVRRQVLVNHKRVERLYREEGLSLPRKRKKRKKASGCTRQWRARSPNEVWCCDFVFDRTQDGRILKLLTVVDEYTRECLEVRVEKRMNGLDVLETMDELIRDRGAPGFLRSDNGSEFRNKHLVKWLQEQRVNSLFIEPGSPWENGFIESFNGKLRDECLDEELFFSRKEAQVVVDWWRKVYNQIRPHSALGYQSPAEYAKNAELLGVQEVAH